SSTRMTSPMRTRRRSPGKERPGDGQITWLELTSPSLPNGADEAAQNRQESRGPAGWSGGGGIRTHGPLARTPVFKTGAIDHSATPPRTERKDSPAGLLTALGGQQAGVPGA